MTASTHTTELDPLTPRVESDPTRLLRRRFLTALAVVAPVLFTLSNVIMPKVSGSTAKDLVARIPAVADRLLGASVLYAVASLLLIALPVAIWRIDVRRGSALRLAGGVLVIVGAASNAFGEVVQGYLAWGMHNSDVTRASQVRVFDLLDKSSAALPISFIAIPVLSLGLLLMMIGVLRAGVVPIWMPVLTIVAALASGFVGVGIPALVGLVWALAAGAIVVTVASRLVERS